MDKYTDVKKGSEQCTEKCQVLKKEVIKFFCPVHEARGCNDCIILNHRTCDLDYIPDKCAAIGDSNEYREVMRDLDQKINETEDVIKLAARTIYKLTHKEGINIRTKSDKGGCYITGCAVLCSSKLVLADYDNNKLKVVDSQRKVVIEEKALESNPLDIAVLPQDQIAVTMPMKMKILLMSTAGKLSVTRSIPVQGDCRGISYHQGQLYTVCVDPKCVCIIDTQSNVQNTISLDNDRFVDPSYILLSEDLRRIYISNYGSNSVISITLQGDISAEYKNMDFKEPLGMLMLEDGSLLLCCGWSNGSIYRISGDLKQGQTMVGDLRNPQSLCCNHHKHEVYVGCWWGDTLKVLSANKCIS